ncbi:uncharacterized protein LOC115673144 [Syzygium oleosum]|uniref:uncharacterized protein LOC115673144 n=1 Tax=Syzygium oleosum TaxID=219896 RepID=UPI0011D2AC20|nr:uncharacterized protein LOC115673144 [Syzygium oleosum]
MSDTPLPRDFDDADDDALSFCDLHFSPLHQPDPPLPPTSPLLEASDFEFSTAGPTISAVDAFLFCGKSIPFDERARRVDSLLLRSDSFGRLNSFRRDGAKVRFASGQLLRSNSLRVARSRSSVAPAAASVVGSSSSRRRQYRALIGITKFPARMELSDIRKRQGRRAPAPLFPAAEGEKQDSAAGGRSGGHRSLLGPSRCRSHFVNALAKASLGCIPHM